MTFGGYVRGCREGMEALDRRYSLRGVAGLVGIQPSYLSKIERDLEAPPGEETIKRLAEVLEQDPDLLLAMAGKISSDLRRIILQRPGLMSELLRELKEMPDDALLRVVREVRDGDW